VVIVGEDEVKNKTVTLKNLATREQTELPIDEVISKLR
jgi:histidyl-tRNA synthetase